MPKNLFSKLEITEIVFDLMNVRIKCPSLKKSNLRYSILNSNNTALRKGSFVGENIQLNLYLIPDGKYFFKLYHEEEGTEFSLPFLKKAI